MDVATDLLSPVQARFLEAYLGFRLRPDAAEEAEANTASDDSDAAMDSAAHLDELTRVLDAQNEIMSDLADTYPDEIGLAQSMRAEVARLIAEGRGDAAEEALYALNAYMDMLEDRAVAMAAAAEASPLAAAIAKQDWYALFSKVAEQVDSVAFAVVDEFDGVESYAASKAEADRLYALSDTLYTHGGAIDGAVWDLLQAAHDMRKAPARKALDAADAALDLVTGSKLLSFIASTPLDGSDDPQADGTLAGPLKSLRGALAEIA